MKTLEFKSQLATTKEQSEKLLALGLKKETADMHITNMSSKGINYTDDWQIGSIPYCNVMSFWDNKGLQLEKTAWSIIPAWSLHRLIELMPEVIFDALLCVFKDSIRYEALVFDRIEVLNDVVSDNMYDNAIATIEWLIKEGYFNKDYLEEKK